MEDLLYRATGINTFEEYQAWEANCDEYRDFLREVCRTTRQSTSTEFFKSVLFRNFSTFYSFFRLIYWTKEGFGHAESSRTELSWMEIETAFINRVLTGAVVNANYIEPRQFLNDARDIVLHHVRINLRRPACLKVNTIFNREFVADDKRSVKSIATKNHELYGASDLDEWYNEYVMNEILTWRSFRNVIADGYYRAY
ncbi:hypothetical protein ALC62_15395 [Cyphomyrmex costatus]|uniref:Uncharacterized protein n=1 Tax=Cyphomyrmex costatus TaxID=456900 RepID=A0A151I736_9HYME|nr:hypothetical protein ALC62_15395 [Cyphomyrmex costatus]